VDVATGKRVVWLRERILRTFTTGDWEAVGLLTGRAEVVEGHPRLLRSLRFRDEDYSGNALTVLRTLVEADPASLTIVEDYLNDHYPEPTAPLPDTLVTAARPDAIAQASHEYDVALSFAGEDRAYVEQVAERLRAANVRVFYDAFETAALWGKNLIDHLAEVYGQRSRFVVIFASKHYAAKAWPTHERQAAQARAFKEQRVVVLPARFDNTEVPGLPPTVAYVDLNTVSVDELVALILAKVGEAA